MGKTRRTQTPLTPRYDGPYQVLERHQKYFKLRLGNKEDTVAIDRLKQSQRNHCVKVGPQPSRQPSPRATIKQRLRDPDEQFDSQNATSSALGGAL